MRGISLPSAHVFCSRSFRRGDFIRLKKNFYVLERNWERFGTREFFQICNLLQVPSYVSCMTALAFHGITTQVQQGWYDSVGWRRSVTLEARGVSFVHHKVQMRYYYGFFRQDGYFIAEPEKAFVDAVYLEAIGRRPLDWSSLNLDVIDRRRVAALMEPFPEPVKRRISEACRI